MQKLVGWLLKKGPLTQTYPHPIFMAVARWCGHDSRGLPIPHDDIPRVMAEYDKYKLGNGIQYDRFGFEISEADIIDDVYLPKYYNPEIQKKDRCLERNPRHSYVWQPTPRWYTYDRYGA